MAVLYGVPNIQKIGRIRWEEHVARYPENNPINLVFVIDPIATRSAEMTMARPVEA